jgi:Cu-Zn family superoxide dismutase
VRKHGYLAEGGPEAGDLPNQFAGADGKLHASVIASGFALGNGKRSIFDHDGVAIIVDQRGDDYRTQPLGNAGARIACGVVVRTEGPLPRPPLTATAKAH